MWIPRVNFGLLSRGAKFFHKGYLAHFLSVRDDVWQCWGVWPIETYFPNFVNFGPGPVTPCGDMHQCFIGTLVKWFLDNFPMFADSFNLFLFTALTDDMQARHSCFVIGAAQIILR